MKTKTVDSLLKLIEETEPVFYSLGTPELAENNEAMGQLVGMGAEVVPQLVERIQGNASKKTAAYAAMALGLLGDARAVEPLLGLRLRYQSHEPKDEWDYAVIGQCQVALSRLEKPSP